jgi:hypothetical protein
MRFPILASLLFVLVSGPLAADTIFEDLDKPPDGAYGGQFFLGAVAGMGIARGSIIDAEDNFVRNTTYTFEDAEITKLVELQHFSFALGIAAEYMPIDHVGVKSRFVRRWIAQRTLFGPDYPNEQEYILTTFDLTLGPNIHLTTRRAWDVTLHPFAGYSLGTFHPAAVADKLSDGVTGSKDYSNNTFIYGAELAGVLYFSGGLFISFGMEWTRYPIEFSGTVSRTTPDTRNYNGGSRSGEIDAITVSFSAGYAFKN